jgi:hypothetical protein
MARKPMLRVPVDDSADPKERFDRLLSGLLSVKKTELQKIETAINIVKKEKPRRQKAK